MKKKNSRIKLEPPAERNPINPFHNITDEQKIAVVKIDEKEGIAESFVMSFGLYSSPPKKDKK